MLDGRRSLYGGYVVECLKSYHANHTSGGQFGSG